MDKYFYPKESGSKLPDDRDSDIPLLLLIILLVIRERGDSLLILALIYILS